MFTGVTRAKRSCGIEVALSANPNRHSGLSNEAEIFLTK